MIEHLEVNDEIRLENDKTFIVHKICVSESRSKDKTIYGLGLDPNCAGNFEWYYETGKPVSYWVNKYTYETIFKPKTIKCIIKKN